MHQILRLSPLLSVLLLAGCSMGPANSDMALGPTLAQPNPALATQPVLTPASVPASPQVTAGGQAMTNVTAYLDAAVVGRLSAKDKSEAAGVAPISTAAATSPTPSARSCPENAMPVAMVPRLAKLHPRSRKAECCMASRSGEIGVLASGVS